MTDMSVDSRAASVTPLHFIDEDMPTSEIPEIEEIGSQDDIAAADEDTLVAKFDEYAEAAPTLVEHHNWQRSRFDEAYDHYIKIFTALETLDSISASAEAVAPGFKLLEEFEIINLEGDAAKTVATIAKVTMYAGGLATLASVYKAGKAANTASKLLAVGRGQPIGAANSPAALRALKKAKGIKVFGAVAAGVSVVSAGIGIFAAIENEKKRMAFLRESVGAYQDWYRSTKQAHDDLSAGAAQMEAEIQELMDLLNFTSPEALENYLDGAIGAAGEVQGKLQTATKMLCSTDPSFSPAQVITLTGLPSATVSRRKAMIDQNPNICTTGS